MTPDETAAEVERLYHAWLDGPLDDAPLHEVLGMTSDQADAYMDHGTLPHGYESPIHPGPLDDDDAAHDAAVVRAGSFLVLMLLALSLAFLVAIYFGADR
jgi:hypothetical protein